MKRIILSLTLVLGFNLIYAQTSKEIKYDQYAKKIEKITWKDFRKIVGNKWDPGMNAPFDPIASKLAEEEKMEVAIMNGKDVQNLKNYLNGKKFKGTSIV